MGPACLTAKDLAEMIANSDVRSESEGEARGHPCILCPRHPPYVRVNGDGIHVTESRQGDAIGNLWTDALDRS